MGFTTGFTGGVTVTLSLAYLSVLAHQRTREQQGQILRSQALVLQGLVDPFPPLPPPTRSEVAAAQRSTAVEVAKDRWNNEVQNAVRWVQQTDWVLVREGLEDQVTRLFGGEPSAAVGRAEKNLVPLVKEGGAQVASAAKGAFEKAKAKGQEVIAATLENGKEIINQAEGGAVPTLSPVQAALNQRFEKSEAPVNQSVEEALKQRYTPMDKRNNTVLRGV
ncbi:hypothetical protein B0J13DRAFT_551604 [Dactylonectria estremocensis]|uniref:MICOS complex subunit MIC12 n=1 Tax=Dactylonectria estremocensis TaxID=1079267 RepID=A0A9P9EZU5_9HYPO|nr:hypothetical protein B0J13DRAFT_551604 [Dactylonectria estremocensis]